MGGKVIKINLMGAIGILILCVCLVVGGIFIANNFNKSEDEKHVEKSQKEQKEEYGEVDITEEVKVNGEIKEIIVKSVKSPYGYKMNYDIDKFYYEKKGEFDGFGSQTTETSQIVVKKIDASFDEKVTELTVEDEGRKMQNRTYVLSNAGTKAGLCMIEKYEENDVVYKNYYMQAGENSYFMVETTCGMSYAENIVPVVDKMIESFEVVQE